MHQWLSKTRLRILSAVYTVLILLLVTLPINGEDQVLGKLNDNYVLHVRYDYISHTLLFIPWTVLLGWGWLPGGKNRTRKAVGVALALGFAVICECIQLPLSYRTFNINDLLANLLGVLLGFLLIGIWTKDRAGQHLEPSND